MAIRSSNDAGSDALDECVIRIAATGDIHLGRDGDQERWSAAFAGLRDRVDLVLLAGDLTTHGEPEQAAMVAGAVGEVDVPILAVLGNHDWHVNRREEMVAVLREGGIDVLEREHRVLELCGTDVGIAGCKGFGGGFDGAHIPDFGEPLMREVYAESIREADALDAALRAIALCPFRIALLHYAPITATLHGERSDIWPFLGTDRLAAPLRRPRHLILLETARDRVAEEDRASLNALRSTLDGDGLGAEGFHTSLRLGGGSGSEVKRIVFRPEPRDD